MDKKGPVIKTNGKTITTFPKESTKKYQKETAATLEESNENVPEYVRQISEKPKRNQNSFIKPIIIASLSALFVGTALSIIMFQLFVHVDQDSASSSPSVPVTNTNQTETVDNAVTRTTQSLEPFQLFVLQAGVFSERENANQWATTFEQANIPTMIWERENQVYLFVGSAGTKEEAERLKEQLNTDEEMEIYIKEWSTLPKTVELTEQEIQWVTTFYETLKTVINNEQNGMTINKENFMNISKLDTTDTLAPLVEEINRLEGLSGNDARIFLLQLLFKYENINHSNEQVT